MRLKGKRCLVTGGSRNFGRALALALAQNGADVAFTWQQEAKDAEDTERLLSATGQRILSFRGHVADKTHVDATVSAITAAWGGVDVLINNAGRTQILPIALLEEKDWDEAMAVHVKGTYLFSRAVLKPMIKARSGHILNIGSFAAERPLQAPIHYVAAKAAVRGFTEALAMEVGRYGVRVNVLVPGMMTVGLSRRLPAHRVEDYRRHTSIGRLVTPEEVANAAVWVLSDENTMMSGAAIPVDGGL